MKYQRLCTKGSYFAYANADPNVTYHLGIHLFPSINPRASNAKILWKTHRHFFALAHPAARRLYDNSILCKKR